jgi:hypothetical protein
MRAAVTEVEPGRSPPRWRTLLRSTRFRAVVLIGALFGVIVVVAFAPIVRHEAADVAARYGGSIDIDRVVPVWGGVRLDDVSVSLDEVPSVRVSFERVTVRYGAGGRTVTLTGGEVRAVGPWRSVYEQADRWRDRHLRSSGGSGGGQSGLEVDDLRFEWTDREEDPAQRVVLEGVRVQRALGKTALEAARAELGLGLAQLSVTQGRVTLSREEGGYKIEELAASAIAARVDLSDDADLGAAAEVPSASGDAAAGGGAGERVRRLLGILASEVDGHLAADAKVGLQGLTAKITRGADQLNLGPGTFVIARREGDLTFELRPDVAADTPSDEAITFAVRVPLAKADKPIRASVNGGPIYLSALGIRDGDFGLLEVQESALETHVALELSGDGRVLTLDGSGTLRGLSLHNAAIAREPVRGIDVSWRGKGALALDGSRLTIDEGELQLGQVRLQGRGLFEAVTRGEARGYSVDAAFEMPLTACQSVLDSAPEGLIPVVKGMAMAGTLSVKGHAKLDTTQLDRSYDVDWVSSNSCRITEAPPRIHVSRFRSPFKRSAYDSKGREIEVESGPETPGWTPYRSISRFMEVAVISCEDGRFLRHDGFDDEAIKNSLRENLRAKKFVRGASTISMQLAKNLYLRRDKSVSRKLQEAFLTMYLEQELTKEQILELYLNVVEFAPDVYGIGPAAAHYFNSSPGRLSLGQSLYLASVLPNPKQQHFGAGGAVTAGWMRYLHTLMRHAHKRRRLSDEDLEEGLGELVVFGSPAPRRSEDGVYPEGEPGVDPLLEGTLPWEEQPGGWVAP